MANPTDRIVADLEHDWPRWQIWVVHRYIGGPLWCARRWDDEKRLLHADTPDQLAEYLEDEAAR